MNWLRLITVQVVLLSAVSCFAAEPNAQDEKEKTAVSHETGLSFSIDSEQEKSWIRADKYLEKGIRPEQLDQEVMKLLKL